MGHLHKSLKAFGVILGLSLGLSHFAHALDVYIPASSCTPQLQDSSAVYVGGAYHVKKDFVGGVSLLCPINWTLPNLPSGFMIRSFSLSFNDPDQSAAAQVKVFLEPVAQSPSVIVPGDKPLFDSNQTLTSNMNLSSPMEVNFGTATAPFFNSILVQLISSVPAADPWAVLERAKNPGFAGIVLHDYALSAPTPSPTPAPTIRPFGSMIK